MDIAEMIALIFGIICLIAIIVTYIKGPWYREPIGRFFVILFVALASVYVVPISRVIQGVHVTISSLTFAIVFAIILAYGVFAIRKANKVAADLAILTKRAAEIDQWET